jgi:hypothetical protein
MKRRRRLSKGGHVRTVCGLLQRLTIRKLPEFVPRHTHDRLLEPEVKLAAGQPTCLSPQVKVDGGKDDGENADPSSYSYRLSHPFNLARSDDPRNTRKPVVGRPNSA